MTTQPLSVTVLVDPSIQRGGRFIDQFVSADPDSRVLAIVPKRGNRGGRRRKRPGVLLTTEQLAQLGSGCSCCTVRTDIRSKIRRIAAENSADQVVIQMGPSSDLVTLAKSFTVADHNGVSLLDVAQLQSMVVVVDAQTAMEQLQSGDAWGLLQPRRRRPERPARPRRARAPGAGTTVKACWSPGVPSPWFHVTSRVEPSRVNSPS